MNRIVLLTLCLAGACSAEDDRTLGAVAPATGYACESNGNVCVCFGHLDCFELGRSGECCGPAKCPNGTSCECQWLHCEPSAAPAPPAVETAPPPG